MIQNKPLPFALCPIIQKKLIYLHQNIESELCNIFYVNMKFELYILLLFFFIGCKSETENKTNNQKTETIQNTIFYDTIRLSENIEVIRETRNNQFSIDYLEVNHYRIDSCKTIPMLYPSECNFIFKNGNKLDTTYKSYSIFGNYLLIKKDEGSVISIKIYNLLSKKRLPILNTEELIVDTIKNELFLIRNRGIIRNYILKLKLENDSFIKIDSVENIKKNRIKIGLNNRL